MVTVPPTPSPLPSLSVFISGPSQLSLGGEGEEDGENRRVCWEVETKGGGGRGVEFEVESDEVELGGMLEVEKRGWEGEGRGRVCGERWGELEGGREYEFQVKGKSILFQTEAQTSFSLFLSPSPPLLPSSSSSCPTPSLWDSSLSSIYGIQTFPSSLTSLPSSLRSFPLTITTKALTPCEQTGMSKDILPPCSNHWFFPSAPPSGLADVDPNDWSINNGTQLVIPSMFLSNRDAFPAGKEVRISVTTDFFSENGNFSGDVTILFLPSPVVMIEGGKEGEQGGGEVIGVDDDLVIDFSGSYTNDGIIFEEEEEEWEWEWEWECITPREGKEEGREGGECIYEGGKVIEMPGREEGRFELEEGEKLKVGVAYYFVVRGKVRERGGDGEVVAEGRWGKVFSAVEEGGEVLGLEMEWWRCEDSSVGYSVCVSFFLFFLLLLNVFNLLNVY